MAGTCCCLFYPSGLIFYHIIFDKEHFFINKVWYLIMFFRLASLFSLINSLNFSEEVTSPSTSIIFSIKYYFSSIAFCSFGSFSNFTFSILSILKVRISSFRFLYLLILSCLFFLAMVNKFFQFFFGIETQPVACFVVSEN